MISNRGEVSLELFERSHRLSAGAEILRDKGTEAQRHRAEKPFYYVPMSLSFFVPMCLCNFVPASWCKNETEVIA